MIHDDNGNVGGCGGKYSGWAWAGRGRTELTQEPVQLLLIYYFMNCF